MILRIIRLEITVAINIKFKSKFGSILKKGLRWKLSVNLEELRYHLKQRLDDMTTEVIASIVKRQTILVALSVAGF